MIGAGKRKCSLSSDESDMDVGDMNDGDPKDMVRCDTPFPKTQLSKQRLLDGTVTNTELKPKHTKNFFESAVHSVYNKPTWQILGTTDQYMVFRQISNVEMGSAITEVENITSSQDQNVSDTLMGGKLYLYPLNHLQHDAISVDPSKTHDTICDSRAVMMPLEEQCVVEISQVFVSRMYTEPNKKQSIFYTQMPDGSIYVYTFSHESDFPNIFWHFKLFSHSHTARPYPGSNDNLRLAPWHSDIGLATHTQTDELVVLEVVTAYVDPSHLHPDDSEIIDFKNTVVYGITTGETGFRFVSIRMTGTGTEDVEIRPVYSSPIHDAVDLACNFNGIMVLHDHGRMTLFDRCRCDHIILETQIPFPLGLIPAETICVNLGQLNISEKKWVPDTNTMASGKKEKIHIDTEICPEAERVCPMEVYQQGNSIIGELEDGKREDTYIMLAFEGGVTAAATETRLFIHLRDAGWLTPIEVKHAQYVTICGDIVCAVDQYGILFIIDTSEHSTNPSKTPSTPTVKTLSIYTEIINATLQPIIAMGVSSITKKPFMICIKEQGLVHTLRAP